MDQNQTPSAAIGWGALLGSLLLCAAAIGLCTPAHATTDPTKAKPTQSEPATAATKTDAHKPVQAKSAKAAPAKPVVSHSGTPTPRLQAANAGIQSSLDQLHGRSMTATQRASSLRGLARNPSSRGGWMSCVPYARSVTGMAVSGNAWQWWNSAAGTYERGFRPEPGAVLNFRSTGRMRLGHVAVVSRVVNSREIEIDHANWGGSGIAHGVAVMDVSEANDWSAVRVSLSNAGTFGSVYPTYGFIYNRADHGVMVANTLVHPAKAPHFEEVAEVRAAPHPVATPRFIDAANGR